MNSVTLIGRLTKAPEVKYSESGTAMTRFSIAIDRGKDKNGNERGADFPNIVAFGKTAELCGKYLDKGRMVGIQGHIQTGSYEKDGRRIYTTDVCAERVEFLDWGDGTTETREATAVSAKPSANDYPAPEGFSRLEDDIPF